jgi:hypothetical protein
MSKNRIDERYSSAVDVPQLSGRVDAVTAFAMQALAGDPALGPEDVRRERDRIVGERRRGQAAERARRKSAVEQLARDVAVAMRRA